MGIFELLNLVLFIIAIIGITKLVSYAYRLVQKRFQTSIQFRKMLWKVSFVFVLLSPFMIPIRVAEKSDFSMLSFGFPVGYVQQYTYHVKANLEYPFLTTLINPWGHSIAGNLNIRVDLFIISMACVYLIIYLLAFIAKELKLIKRPL